MAFDFTIAAYTLLAVYILLYVAVGAALFFTIKSTVLGLKSLFRGSLKENAPYEGALTS